jgi:hypothetical protein
MAVADEDDSDEWKQPESYQNLGCIRLTSKKEYWNVVRNYSPPGCVTYFGKLINVFDNILLGANSTQIAYLKDFFGTPSNTPNADFAAELSFLCNLQSHSWLPCLNQKANPSFCQDLTARTVLFQKPKLLKAKRRGSSEMGDGQTNRDSHDCTPKFPWIRIWVQESPGTWATPRA